MDIGFLERKNKNEMLGGDIVVLDGLIKGLTELGISARWCKTIEECVGCDLVLISNSIIDWSEETTLLSLLKIPYAFMPFHEDLMSYWWVATGLPRMLQAHSMTGVGIGIEEYIRNPILSHYFSGEMRKTPLYNYHAIMKAVFAVTNSQKETTSFQRDYTGVNVCEIPVFNCNIKEFTDTATDEFLELIPELRSGEYILQIGRIEYRKNQISTILATDGLSMPLVFIAPYFSAKYLQSFIPFVLQYRKDPLYILCPYFNQGVVGPIHFIRSPGGKNLSHSTLQSAYAHAALHLHPAFHELPGATYLEALKMGLPTVASSWTSLPEFIREEECEGNILKYVAPTDIPGMRKAVREMISLPKKPLDHPYLKRTHLEYAEEFRQQLSKMGYPC